MSFMKLLSFSNCLRHAFFAGAGYGELEQITEADQKRWVEYDPPMVGAFVKMDTFLRDESATHAKNLALQVEGALLCPMWHWDNDQFEAALHVLNEYRKSIGEEPFTVEQTQAIREQRKP